MTPNHISAEIRLDIMVSALFVRVRWINIVFHLKTVQYSDYHCASTLGLWDMIITYTGTSSVLPQREYECYQVPGMYA